MSKTDKDKVRLAREIIEEYIEIGIRTGTGVSKRLLAKILYSRNPDIYKDEEDARWCIRYSLNSAGTLNRAKNTPDLERAFALIAEPIRELNNNTPFEIPKVYNNILVINDLHSRFYSKGAFSIAVNNGIKRGVNAVLINGDFMDFYQHSRFDKNPSIIRYFEEEREWGQDILKLLQDTFGQVFLKQGNHDLRRELHIERLSATMPELQGLTSYQDYLFYEGSNTEFIEDYRHITFGKLNIIHGHEYQGGGGIHIAWNRLNKAFDNVLSAHSHRGQSITRQTINKEIFGSWAVGCMCDLNPRYAPKNDWTQGFAIVQRDTEGYFEVENKIIVGKKLCSV